MPLHAVLCIAFTKGGVPIEDFRAACLFEVIEKSGFEFQHVAIRIDDRVLKACADCGGF